MSKSVEERFWAKVEKTETCWNWTGSKNEKGYGSFGGGKRVSGGFRTVRAHRFSYEITIGSIPDGMQIDHICHNKGCVNPDHLRVVTNKQNHENHSGIQGNNKSGAIGVSWRTYPSGKGAWKAVVGHNYKRYHAGCYATVAEAESAVVAKRLELFTHNDHDRAK